MKYFFNEFILIIICMKVEKNIRIFMVLKEVLFFYEEVNEFKRKIIFYDLIVFKRLMFKYILLLNIYKIII